MPKSSVRPRVRFWLLAAAWLAACGTVESEPVAAVDASSPDAMSTDAMAAPDAAVLTAACSQDPSCGEVETISSVDDLIAVTRRCPTWDAVLVDRYRNRTATIRVGSDIEVCVGHIPLPLDCSGGIPCEAGVRLEVDRFLAGVDSSVGCPGGVVLAAGARFRIRYDVMPGGQRSQFRVPNLRFERACDAACSPSERRCDGNGGCYPADEVCFACGRGTQEQCACRSPDNGVIGDCESCAIRGEGTVSPGHCLGGSCTRDACATCPC